LADEVRLRNKIGSLKHDESPQEEEQRKQPGEDSADQKVDADDNDNNVDAEKAKETSDKVQARHAAAAHEIRLRMLQNLGIQKQQAAPLKASVTDPLPSSALWGPDYAIPLNDADATPLESESATTATITTTTAACSDSKTTDTNSETDGTITATKAGRKRSLHFDPTVTVHPIPSFKVYSNRIRETIWTSAYELQENVARNALEFSYEDWDADHVLDEDTGLIYIQHQNNANNSNGNSNSQQGGGGEWIHPVHFGAPPREEGTPLSSDEIWKHTCQRLGIHPAEYFHDLPSNPNKALKK